MGIVWMWQHFDTLSAADVYRILAIRQAVFVVEQECLYLDADDRDKDAWHLLGYDSQKKLVAYARVLPPNTRYVEPSIGRVLVAKTARGFGFGRELIARSLEKCKQEYPAQTIRVSAQVYLTAFYEGFGFRVVGEPYDDGGIPHVSMVLAQSGNE